MRILVLGGYGLLGSRICKKLKDADHFILMQGRGLNAQISIDPFDVMSIRKALLENQIDCILNLIALTDVNRCELEVKLAYKLNAFLVEQLAEIVSWNEFKDKVKLVHISTDHVYDGLGPHVESHASPCNVYGITKLLGERFALDAGGLVVRTNFYGKSLSNKPSFSDWIVNTLKSNNEITLFTDVIFSAMHVDGIADSLEWLINHFQSGVFNLGSVNSASKAIFGLELARKLNLDTDLISLKSISSSNLPVLRPMDMSMNSDKLQKAFRYKLPTIESQLEITVREYIDV
jgi:dTDP-4-dehydrorhamnose reductase